MKYNIIIPTFKERFDVFKNLVLSIRQFNKEIDITVCVNGDIDYDFDETYRSELYNFLKDIPKTFIRIWPEFRGLSKIINDGLISSKNDYVLYISDDTVITSEKFFEDIEVGIEKYKGMFRVNMSCGVIVFNIHQMNSIGYYDERLITIGKEDADMFIRYRQMYNGSEMPSHSSDHVKEISSQSTQSGYETRGDVNTTHGKYPILNEVIFNKKLNSGFVNYQQYPYEKFYRMNKPLIKNSRKDLYWED
jgi:predicted glycosyltransferase involved in capsule biosynthesis